MNVGSTLPELLQTDFGAADRSKQAKEGNVAKAKLSSSGRG